MTLTARMDGKAMKILRDIKARLIGEGNDKATLYDAVNWMDAHIKSLEKEKGYYEKVLVQFSEDRIK